MKDASDNRILRALSPPLHTPLAIIASFAALVSAACGQAITGPLSPKDQLAIATVTHYRCTPGPAPACFSVQIVTQDVSQPDNAGVLQNETAVTVRFRNLQGTPGISATGSHAITGLEAYWPSGGHAYNLNDPTPSQGPQCRTPESVDASGVARSCDEMGDALSAWPRCPLRPIR